MSFYLLRDYAIKSTARALACASVCECDSLIWQKLCVKESIFTDGRAEKKVWDEEGGKRLLPTSWKNRNVL